MCAGGRGAWGRGTLICHKTIHAQNGLIIGENSVFQNWLNLTRKTVTFETPS